MLHVNGAIVTVERFFLRDIPRQTLDAEAEPVLAALRAALPAWARVAEVGSTAVPGVIGKGDIDLLVLVPPEHFEAARAAIDALYPRNPRQLSNATYQGYTVHSPLDVAIQLTVAGGAHDFFDAFLDRLRGSPALVEAYNALKRRFDGEPMDDYRAAKAAFIEAALRETAQGTTSAPERAQ